MTGRHRFRRRRLVGALRRGTGPGGRGSRLRRRLVATALAVLACVLVAQPAPGGGRSASTGEMQRDRFLPLLVAAPLAAAPTTSTPTTTAPATPAGHPTVAISSPANGSTATAGTAVTLVATLSADLVTALQAGSGGLCYFVIGDDAHSTTQGVLDLNARTCTGSWTFAYTANYAITAAVTTPSGITYNAPPITVTVSGTSNPRCTGNAGAPAGCVYRWTEVYYTTATNTRYARVCSIDGGCQWQTTHTSWPQIPGTDYWINSTSQPLGDGNNAEAYLCLGSSPTDWTNYTNNHSLDTLLARPETSTAPLPAGTC